VREEGVEQLHAALAAAGLLEAAPGGAAGDQADAAPDTASRSPSAASAPEPERPGAEPDDASRIAAADPSATPSPETSSELAKFNANIQYLNRRAAYVAGSNLFEIGRASCRERARDTAGPLRCP